MCALGDFPASFASVLRQIARYLPRHGSKTASKTHPKSSHDKFKTVSKTPPPCRGGGPKGRRGLTSTLLFRMAHKRVIMPPHGTQKGHYAPAWWTNGSFPCKVGQCKLTGIGPITELKMGISTNWNPVRCGCFDVEN